MTIRKGMVACAVAVLCGAVGVASAGGDKDKADKMAALTDQTFVTKAANASMAEVELSKVALQKSKDDEVRSFAQQMVRDHEKANMELKSVADKKNLMVPKSLDAKHQEKLDKLKAQPAGMEFDTTYSMDMQKGHDDAVALFTAASKSDGLSPEIKGFASKTLPTLQTHHHMAANLPADGKTRAAKSESESKNR